MSLCDKCRKKPWPYALVLFISTFVGFVTWLTLSAVGFGPALRNGLTAAAFLVAAAVLFGYMISCMRRHCADDRHVV